MPKMSIREIREKDSPDLHDLLDAKRKELFDWEKKWHSEMDIKPSVDVGQKYLLIRMRL